MYDFQELCSKIVILVVLQSMVHYYPDLQKYNNETRFNYYRSLMCMTFTCLGLHVGIRHFKNGFSHPFSYHHNDMNEIHYIFMAYLIVDLLKLAANKSKRPDLYIHHLLCIGSIILGISIGKYGYLHSIVLICESISIVTGVDSMAMEENDDYLSYRCKKFRKNIINYVRLPMWIALLIFTLKYTNRAPTAIWYNGIITSVVMIILDKYWERKCDKVIAKYE
jgi:hypothetical protein